MGRLPERVQSTGGLVLRRWVSADAEVLAQAVAESVEHLRPWMAWVSQEPMSLERRRAMLRQWERDWKAGGDVALGMLLGGRVVGSCGLHRRIGYGGLEIGYWTHPSFLRAGIATATASLLTDAAFTVEGITHVEIHHDKANTASAGVPRKLGYRLVDEVPDEPEAPAEIGIECRWRMTRTQWRRLIVSVLP